MPIANYHIDVDKLREASNLWLRRASAFIGVGCNAAEQRPPIPHTRIEGINVVFIPAEIPDEQRLQIADEFGMWIVYSAFRDVIEGHADFLAKAYEAAYIVSNVGICTDHLRAINKAFDRKNVPARRRALSSLLGYDDVYADMFSTLVLARNCFAHRCGVVGQEDINTDDNCLELRWKVLGYFVRSQSGNLKELSLDEGPVQLTEPSRVVMKLTDRSRRFAIGHAVRFSRTELRDLLMGFHLAAELVLQHLIERLIAEGLLPPKGVTPGDAT